MSDKELIKRYVFDFSSYAKEVHGYIKFFYIPANHPVPDHVMIKAMYELIINLVKVVIFDNCNKNVPNEHIDEKTAFEIYAEKCQVDPVMLSKIIMDSILIDRLLEDIHEIILENPWGFYVVRQMTFEFLGDWRILQWEKEHLDDRGNYVHKKDDSESSTTG